MRAPAASVLRSPTTRPPRTPTARIGLICGLCALVLYVFTCAPGVEWQDSGVHQYRIVTGQAENSRGLALSHPLHYWLGRGLLRIPLGEPAYRLNLLSAVCGAIGVGLLAALLTRLVRRQQAVYFAAGALLVAHSYWQMSAVTETYTLAGALMVVEWWLLLTYVSRGRPLWLVALFGVNGLHVADHPLGLLTGVTYVVLLLERVIRGKLAAQWLLAAAVAWLIGASPYLALAAGYYQRTGDLAMTIRSALFGGGETGGYAQEVLAVRVGTAQLALAGLTLGYNFPSLAIPLAVVGITRRPRRRNRTFRRVLLGQTLILAGFVLRYPIPDLYTFFVPVCLLVALWLGLGIDWFLRRTPTGRARRWRTAVLVVSTLLPVAVYVVFPAVARERQWLRSRLRNLPHRDEYAAFFQPWRHGDDSAARFARDTLELVGPYGWVLADHTTAPALAYTCMFHSGPPGVRVYCGRISFTPPDGPMLEPEDVEEYVRSGGRVLAVAGYASEHTWGQDLNLDKSDRHNWFVRPSPEP